MEGIMTPRDAARRVAALWAGWGDPGSCPRRTEGLAGGCGYDDPCIRCVDTFDGAIEDLLRANGLPSRHKTH